MARMTPAEATAVNVLFGYLAAQAPAPPAQVIRSLETLASRAHNRLQAGVSEVSVREQWPEVFLAAEGAD